MRPSLSQRLTGVIPALSARRRRPLHRLAAAVIAAGVLVGSLPAQAAPEHAIAMHGTPKYGADFTHFDYVNPDAPKGGTVKFAAIGSFDSLNPFILQGTAPSGVSLLFDTLMVSSDDEAFTEYGLLAESVEVPADRSWVAFTLRPQARFHDGTPVTVEDVIWSLNTLKTKGQPFYQYYYANVAKAEQTGPRTVRFTFDGTNNRELPLILGQLPVLPKHHWVKDGTEADFGAASLEVPLGSGPYKVATFEAGRYIVYQRNEDWWAKDLPVTRGLYNFDQIRYDFYRDSTVALEAFKAGAYDIRPENVSKLWATAYDFPAVQENKVRKLSFPHHMPSGMQGFAFNLRRAPFDQPLVRKALAYAFDFEWSNQNLFYGQYNRTNSYFDNSELAATGTPSAAELALLEPLKADLPPEVFGPAYKAPSTEGPGGVRANLRQAMALLKQAGYEVKNGVLTNAQGQPLRFEILLGQPTFERVVLPYVQNLKRLGIEASVRTVDSAQYENRVENYDFDMLIATWGQSLSPGNEQREFWGCDAAKRPGSRNLTGVCSPAIEALIDHVITADSRDDLITATRALDRALLWSALVIPQWHISSNRIAFWNHFGMPTVVPMQGVNIFSWWVDPKGVSATFEPQSEGQ
jgi:microcin C transport system substrate-binding protein